MKKRISNYLPIVLSTLLSLGVLTVFRACSAMEDGSWMHCHTAQMRVFGLGLVLIALSVISLFVKNKIANIVLNAASVVVAIVAVITPGVLVSMCMMDTMRCHALMKPFVIVFGVLFIISDIVKVVFDFKSNDKRKELAA